MSSQTENLHLIKPASTDTADIGIINGNMDIIDEAVSDCLPLSGGTLSGNVDVDCSSGDTGFIAKRSDVNVSVGMLVGAAGTNHGIWSYKINKWLVHADASDVYVKGMKMSTVYTSTASDIITAESGITINSASYSVWGKLAEVYISFKCSSAISVPANGNITNFNIGTLASDKRPPLYTAFVTEDNGVGYFGSNGILVMTECRATGSAYSIAANTNIYVYATYILA